MMTICPGSTLDRSSSVGTPRARARSEGSQEATNGTAARTAPTAPTPIVAEVRNLRRLRSTSSLATTMLSATYRLSAYQSRPPRSARIACRAYGTCARGAVSGSRGAAHYTQTSRALFQPAAVQRLIAPHLRRGLPIPRGATDDRTLEPRARFRRRLGGRGTRPRLRDRGAASGSGAPRWRQRPA